MDGILTAIRSGERLGRAALKVRVDGETVFVKYQPECIGVLSRLTRKIAGGSLPFLNEPRIVALLEKNTISDFRFPGLIDNQSPEYCVYEFISNARELGRPITNEMSACVSAILEFHTVRGRVHRPFCQEVLFTLLERPVYRTLRLAVNSGCNVFEKCKIFLMVLKFSISQRPLPGVLLHNDLGFSNIVLNGNNEPVFLDFEDTVFERKWVLSDLVDLFFDPGTMSLDISRVESAWRQLANLLHVDRDAISLKEQIRLCLIKTVLTALASRHERASNKTMIRSFLRVLLDWRQYDSWFRLGCGRKHTPVICSKPEITRQVSSI